MAAIRIVYAAFIIPLFHLLTIVKARKESTEKAKDLAQSWVSRLTRVLLLQGKDRTSMIVQSCLLLMESVVATALDAFN